MLSVKQVSEKTGVSVRTLHHYHEIGLLQPTAVTEAGYRLYDDAALERLQQILLYRELQFSLKDIKTILDSPDYDRNRALEQQIALLKLKREHLSNLILLASGLKLTGVRNLDFKAFETKKLDEYAEHAKRSWGKTEAYKEFEKKSAKRSAAEEKALGQQLMDLLAEFYEMKHLPHDAPQPQAQVEKLRAFMTANYYTCTKEILMSLGRIYGGGGEMTENIDRHGGEGTAEYAAKAIEAYCR